MSDIIAFGKIIIGIVLLGALIYFSPKYVPMTTYNLAGIAAIALIFICIIIHGIYSIKRKHIKEHVEEYAEEQVEEQVKGQVEDQVKGQVEDQVKGQVEDLVKGQVKGQVEERA